MSMNEEILDKDKHIQLLQETNLALAERLSFLNKRMMLKNDEQARKWQAKAFYWKRKYETHLAKCERLTTQGSDPKQGEEDEREIRNSSCEETGCGSGSDEGDIL